MAKNEDSCYSTGSGFSEKISQKPDCEFHHCDIMISDFVMLFA